LLKEDVRKGEGIGKNCNFLPLLRKRKLEGGLGALRKEIRNLLSFGSTYKRKKEYLRKGKLCVESGEPSLESYSSREWFTKEWTVLS